MATSPDNKNFLGQAGFKLALDRIPHVTYFCQSAPIPSVSLSVIEVPSPLVTRPVPGTKVSFNPFTVTFRVDEDMKNYLEILNWIVGIGAPDTTEQRRLFEAQARNNKILSDATLIIYSSKYNPNLQVKFKDMYPTDISELQFTTMDSDVAYLEATATFRYLTFSIETL